MITLLYAGLCTLLVLVLALRVVLWRQKHQIGLGHGGDRELLKRVRAHGNAIENMPMALILLGGLELNGYPVVLIHGLGGTLLLARMAHAFGLSRNSGPSLGRVLGTMVTWLLLSGMAVLAIYGYTQQFMIG